MAQQGRVRRTSMELNAATAAFLQQEGINGMNYSTSSYKQDPFSLLLGQDVAAASGAGMNSMNGVNGLLPMNGLPAMTRGMVEQPQYTEPLCMPGTSCYSSMPLDTEEPGPLPCLPRAGCMAGGYGSNAALFMQQQQLQHLQRCGYSNSGAPGPGGRPLRPRRHSVTIGMLNEHQQQQALLAAGGQLPAGWSGGMGGGAAAGRAGPSRMQVLPPQSSPNKQLQGLNMQAAAAAAQLGISQPALGQSFMAGPPSAGAGIQQLQQLSGTPTPPAGGLAGAVGLGSTCHGGPLGLEMTPGYALDGPRLPGAGGSRRHSWAPMGADASMAYARTWLMQQQQQRGLTAQLADAGAFFVNQQQQDQLGLGHLGAPLGQHNGLDSGAAGLNGRAAALMGDSAGSGLQSQGSFNLSIGQPGPMYGADALAKDQVAHHLHQLQQLQLQDLASRIGSAGQGLDPYAEPFVSQAASLMQPGAGLAGLSGIDPYTTALQQELQQQQQSALALQLVEDAGLSPAAAAAAASMYAPLQVNGVSVDTQSLVSPYVDNWDVLAQGSANSSLSGSNSAVSSSSGVSALAGLGTTPMNHVGLPAKASKGAPLGVLAGGSAGHGSSRAHHSHGLGSNSTNTPAGSGNGSKGSSTAPTAAGAAATMLASLPPLTKVCSDVPWNLKKAADEDAKVMAAQQDQVKKLTAALERSKTLQQVHAAEDAVAEASAAAASAARSTGQQSSVGAADGAAALFGYKLPDSGDDTWGGSSGSADAAAVPGGSCISQEPSNKLFVGNIGWWVTEEDLLHWFSRFGNVINVKIMYNSRKMHKPKDKWRSREYGFIDYASPEEAAKAIIWMDGVELPDLMKDTCGIIVQYAKPTGGNEASGSAA